MPKVSVVIPVYNVERYLRRCLDSVLSQTFQDFEIVCVNDGSTDSSREILSLYATNDERIKVFDQDNQGASVARNNGLKHISGEYVFFLDSDDAIHFQSFEILVRIIEENNVDMVSFNQLDCTEREYNSLSLHKKCIKFAYLDTKYCDKPIFLGTHKGEFIIHFTVTSKFIRRHLLENISFIPQNRFEDLAYSFGLLSKNPKTIVLQETLYYYIVNEQGVFHTPSNIKQVIDYKECLDYIFSLFVDKEQELEFLKKDLVPNVLEQQRRRCRKASGNQKREMYRVFAEELKELYDKGLLEIRYIRFYRYLIYRLLMVLY